MVEALGEAREELLGILETSRDPQDAQREIGPWAERHAGNTQLQSVLWHPMAKAQLGGRLFVHDIEVQDKLDATHRLQRDPDAFLNRPFTAAIDFAIDRGIISEEGLADLDGRWRGRSVDATEAMLRTIQRRTEAALQGAIRRGAQMSEFIATVEEGSAALGLGFRDLGYLENVFRTGVQSAYGAGRFEAMQSPAVIEARPVVQYRTAGDDAVRPEHAALDGTQYHSESSAWHNIAPPNGYQCRCSVVTLAPDEVEGEVLGSVPQKATVNGREVKPGADDPSFDMAPTAQVEAPL